MEKSEVRNFCHPNKDPPTFQGPNSSALFPLEKMIGSMSRENDEGRKKRKHQSSVFFFSSSSLSSVFLCIV